MPRAMAMTYRRYARFLAGIALLAGLLSSSSALASDSATGGSSSAPHPKARELQDLSGKLLVPKPGLARPREDLRALRAALETLATQLVTTQSDPSVGQLGTLRKHLKGAQSAFAVLRGRLISAGGAELAADLEGQFQPLWEDIAVGLTSASRRGERLTAARARVEAALARRADPHGSTYIAFPLRGPR